jgi:hypothetical protein
VCSISNLLSLYDFPIRHLIRTNANFVIGSMTSNVFRLVAELRAAAASRTDLTQRVFSVDVPWMQKP